MAPGLLLGSVARANIYICVIGGGGGGRNLVGMSGLICIQPRLDKWRARARSVVIWIIQTFFSFISFFRKEHLLSGASPPWRVLSTMLFIVSSCLSDCWVNYFLSCIGLSLSPSSPPAVWMVHEISFRGHTRRSRSYTFFFSSSTVVGVSDRCLRHLRVSPPSAPPNSQSIRYEMRSGETSRWLTHKEIVVRGAWTVKKANGRGEGFLAGWVCFVLFCFQTAGKKKRRWWMDIGPVMRNVKSWPHENASRVSRCRRLDALRGYLYCIHLSLNPVSASTSWPPPPPCCSISSDIFLFF